MDQHVRVQWWDGLAQAEIIAEMVDGRVVFFEREAGASRWQRADSCSDYSRKAAQLLRQRTHVTTTAAT